VRASSRIDKSDRTTREAAPLHTHQARRHPEGQAGRPLVRALPSGTGSGKSLAYIVPIVDHVRAATGRDWVSRPSSSIRLNALANSQDEELKKIPREGLCPGPVSRAQVARYTGQEKGLEREAIRSHPPDILLTN